MYSAINKLRDILIRKDKFILFYLLCFSAVVSVIETIGISAIMPFLSVAMDNSLIYSNEYYSYVYNLFGFFEKVDFVLAFGMLLIFFYFFRGGINLVYVYVLSYFTQSMYYDISYRLFENYLGMNYSDFTKRNSSELTKSIITEVSSLTSLISAFLLLMSEIFIVIFIYIIMLWTDYIITITLTVILVLNAILMVQTISKRIKQFGVKKVELHKYFYEVINKTLNNFKLIKLQSNDSEILTEFNNISLSSEKVNTRAQALLQFPRLFLETIGFSLIVIIVMYLLIKYENNLSSVLATLSMFVLALYRLMPSVNKIMNSYNNIVFNSKSLEVVHHDLLYNSEILGNELINMNDKMILQNVNFGYEKDKLVIQSLNLEIKKGEKIAFIGESGSGKSTLVDIIIGLYRQNSGSIIIDDTNLSNKNIKSWRKRIGYIPQSVYLFDGSVAQNIAFGSQYKVEKIDECLKKAKIYDFLQTKNGQDTYVGEGGIMLSGGQKQRIAIARALYLEPEILVLDEATSALDTETEEQIMDEIYDISIDKTLIIIAHRLSTIKKCDVVYKLYNGQIVEKIYHDK